MYLLWVGGNDSLESFLSAKHVGWEQLNGNITNV